MRYVLVFCILACLLFTSCQRHVEQQQIDLGGECEYMLAIVIDMSGSFAEEIRTGGRAYQFMLRLIDGFFKARVGNNDRILISQLSGKDKSLIWEGSPRSLRQAFPNAAAFRDYVVARSNPAGSRVKLAIAESLEYVNSRITNGKPRVFLAVLSDMEDNVGDPKDTTPRLIQALKDFNKNGGVFGGYWISQTELPTWRRYMDDSGMPASRYVLEADFIQQPTVPSFDVSFHFHKEKAMTMRTVDPIDEAQNANGKPDAAELTPSQRLFLHAFPGINKQAIITSRDKVPISVMGRLYPTEQRTPDDPAPGIPTTLKEVPELLYKMTDFASLPASVNRMRLYGSYHESLCSINQERRHLVRTLANICKANMAFTGSYRNEKELFESMKPEVQDYIRRLPDLSLKLPGVLTKKLHHNPSDAAVRQALENALRKQCQHVVLEFCDHLDGLVDLGQASIFRWDNKDSGDYHTFADGARHVEEIVNAPTCRIGDVLAAGVKMPERIKALLEGVPPFVEHFVRLVKATTLARFSVTGAGGAPSIQTVYEDSCFVCFSFYVLARWTERELSLDVPAASPVKLLTAQEETT